MNEIMYGWNSLLIAGLLLALMVVAVEAGHWRGRRKQASTDTAAKDHVITIQGSMLGVLALLLAFSFSLALQRFDDRNAAVVNEANAIGTTFLRAQLLPTSVRGEVRELLRRYVHLRVQAGTITLDHGPERDVLLAESNRILDALWDRARRAAAEAPDPVTSGLFIQSLNGTIDAYGEHVAALRAHVPETIMFLLFGTFLMTAGVLGYAAGIAGHRPSSASYMLVGLIVVLAFVVIDLDRPRRGLITVNQTSLIDTKMMIDQAQSAAQRSTDAASEASPRRQ